MFVCYDNRCYWWGAPLSWHWYSSTSYKPQWAANTTPLHCPVAISVFQGQRHILQHMLVCHIHNELPSGIEFHHDLGIARYTKQRASTKHLFHELVVAMFTLWAARTRWPCEPAHNYVVRHEISKIRVLPCKHRIAALLVSVLAGSHLESADSCPASPLTGVVALCISESLSHAVAI